MTEDKKKLEISIDFSMIIGKYFKSNEDFINIMKANKKYKELVEMYFCNPISDISLFPNIQTQHFYKEEDIKNKKENLFQYIYWYNIDYNKFKNKKNNEIFKNVELGILNNIKENEDIHPLKVEENCIIPEGITKIGEDYFRGCSQLKNIKLPNSLKEIGLNNFYGTNIKNIKIPEGIIKIPKNCFKNCLRLINIEFSNSLIEIDDYAFSFSGLKKINFNYGLKRIGNYCFDSCIDLNEINLPNSLKEIGIGAFKFTIIKILNIPNKITRIEDYCFYKCNQLIVIDLPETLEEIGKKSFYGTNIETISIPDNVKKLGDNCFDDCLNLYYISLPDNLEEIGNKCFYNDNLDKEILMNSKKFEILGTSLFFKNSKGEEQCSQHCFN